MSKFEKLKAKIRNGQTISYDEAETFMLKLGFSVRPEGSHFVFRKDGCKTLSIKKRSQLKEYQIDDLVRVLEDYEKG